MDIIRAEKRKMIMCADELLDIRSELMRYRNELNDEWRAEETEDRNDYVDKINRRIKCVVEELDGIGHDMVKAYEELDED